MPSSRYSFLTDAEAVSFIGTMARELLKIAEEHSLRPLMPGLTRAEQAAKVMKYVTMNAG